MPQIAALEKKLSGPQEKGSNPTARVAAAVLFLVAAVAAVVGARVLWPTPTRVLSAAHDFRELDLQAPTAQGRALPAVYRQAAPAPGRESLEIDRAVESRRDT